MAVRIRLSRIGRLHRPYYRIVAIDKRNAREGLSNEVLGAYDPTLADGKAITIQTDRVEAWLAKGAQISSKLDSLFKHHSIAIKRPVAKPAAKPAAKAKAKAAPTKKGTYVAPSRRALRKHAAKLKAVRKAKAAAEAPAKPAAEAPAAAEAPKA